MTRQQLIDSFGFKEMPHFTIGNTVYFTLGRNRRLTASDVGGGNEFMFLTEVDDENNPKKVTDCICVHNYDHDGFLTEEKLMLLINGLTFKNK